MFVGCCGARTDGRAGMVGEGWDLKSGNLLFSPCLLVYFQVPIVSFQDFFFFSQTTFDEWHIGHPMVKKISYFDSLTFKSCLLITNTRLANTFVFSIVR